MRRLPLLLCLPAALALTLRPARLTDAWGVGRVCADAFYPPGSKINGVDARYAWASTVLQRLVAMRRGALRPHALLVAVDADAGVVGCVELGLLPAPPGAPPASRLSTEASEAAALWRGVAVDNAVAWAPPEGDCPTLANVAVARSHRKRAVGRRLVDAAADALEGDVAWVDWRRAAAVSDDVDAVYARVTDDEAVAFWERVGFDAVPTDGADVRGKGGVWLRRPLARRGGAPRGPAAQDGC